MIADALKVLFDTADKASGETKKIRLEKIISAAGKEFTYSDRALTLVAPPLPPLPATLNLSTLSGLVNLVPSLGYQPDALMLHIVDAHTVHALPQATDEFGRRPILATATAALPDSKIGKWIDHEDFSIWMLYGFAPSPDRDYGFNVSAKLTAGTRLISEDNGVTQVVTFKTGIESKDEAPIRSRILLAPWRTFREVPQPLSEFIFRVRDAGQGEAKPHPECILMESDGGSWRIDASRNIATFLECQLKLQKIEAKVIL